MANMLDELRSSRPGRRTLLQAGGAAGALLAAGIPAYVLADQGNATVARAARGQNPFKDLTVAGHVASRTAQAAQVVGAAQVAGFRGKATITGFYAQGTQIIAIGMVDGVLHDASGKTVQQIQAAVQGPVTFQKAASGQAMAAAPGAAAPTDGCQILNLVLAPLVLNLLGLLIVIPDPVILNIVAVAGAGNLLGNLLCAVAGLLDGQLSLADILNLGFLLNNILAQFGL